MAAEYKQLNDQITGELSETILRAADQAFIPPDPANRDRAEYESWLAEGNQPDPPDPLPEPEPPPPDPNQRLNDGVSAAVETYNSPPPTVDTSAGGAGGLSVEERLLRLEATVQAMCEGQMEVFGASWTFSGSA